MDGLLVNCSHEMFHTTFERRMMNSNEVFQTFGSTVFFKASERYEAHKLCIVAIKLSYRDLKCGKYCSSLETLC